MKPFRTVDPAQLPSHFDAASAEARWDKVWDARGWHRWDPARRREDTFVVDTPPPTVSGSLHMGHCFSYTHPDVIVRQRRMRGQNIFYPMGWDDNGLPTERRVQNLVHVRCDPSLPYEPGLALEPAAPGDGDRKKLPPRVVSRKNFIELCHRVTAADEQAFEALFRRLGLSVDWTQTYATIDDRCRRLAQRSFLELYAGGHAYSLEAPTMWDVDFQTALAQADLTDVVRAGAFHDIRFAVEGTGEHVTISTTRPELLPACVAVTAHPDDARYQPFFGKHAVTPLFGAPVPIFPSELADPTKGTGILMVCTFGDQTDVHWWREQHLPLRQILGRDGRLQPVTYGSPAYPSRDAAAASHAYGELAGKTVAQAQRRIALLLREAGALAAEPRPIQHAVKMYEKGERPLEFVTTRQWFVKLLAQKDALLAQGDAIRWHPDFMRLRYRNWTENLGLDWCVSRQRYFGVPIPVWYPVKPDGSLDYAAPILPSAAQLPIDPMSDVPAGFTQAQRGRPGGFAGDPDVFDTWFTSSLSPQIGSHWGLDPERHKKLFPADLRPQSHEIIRTWAFYTIAKALLHEASVPWHHVAISGWILDPDRKKMGKSTGNAVTPHALLDAAGADGVRYWAASARLGMDTTFDDKVLKIGKRLVTKLFNAGKFVLAQTAEPGPITCELDRAFVAELRALIDRASASFDEFDYAQALQDTEKFFWSRFTDAYLELAKARARGDGDAAGRTSAVATLRLGLDVLLRLFAPFVPFVTEEVWSWAFAEERDQPTIHRAPWPSVAELAAIAPPGDPASLQLAIDVLTAINKAKTERGAGVGRGVARLDLRTPAAHAARIAPVLGDVLASTRVREHQLIEAAAAEADLAIEVAAMELLPKTDATDASRV